MKEIEKIVGELLKRIKKDKEVIAVIVFGSFLTQKNYNDIDVCLVLDKIYSKSSMFDKRLKYLGISKKEVDIQIFQQLPLYLRIEILKHGKVIFCKDTKKLYEIALATIKEFESFKAKYKDYISRELVA